MPLSDMVADMVPYAGPSTEVNRCAAALALADRIPAGYVPELGDTVIYYNRHGFGRAAIVTGTSESLVGEQHVPMVSSPTAVHLTILSPLPSVHHKHDVPLLGVDDNARGCYRPRTLDPA